MKLRFDHRYFLVAIMTFGLGVLTATTFKQLSFIRGSVSDIIATMFVFFAVLSACRVRHRHLAIATLLLAGLVETGQYFHLADRLGLARGSLPSILLGNHFSVYDLIFYIIGVLASLLVTSYCIREIPARAA